MPPSRGERIGSIFSRQGWSEFTVYKDRRGFGSIGPSLPSFLEREDQVLDKNLYLVFFVLRSDKCSPIFLQ